MAQSKKNTIPTTDATGKAPDGSNGQVDSVDTTNKPPVDTTKLLVGKMKSIGLDSKGLYTEWNGGALDSDGNNGALDMIDFMVSKKKLTTDDKTALLSMFAKMQQANTPKVKVVKVIPSRIG